MIVVAVVFLIFSFKSAHTQNTQTERINAMITDNVSARKAEYYDLSGNDMEPPLGLDTSSSSSDGQKLVEIIFTLTTILTQLGTLTTNQF